MVYAISGGAEYKYRRAKPYIKVLAPSCNTGNDIEWLERTVGMLFAHLLNRQAYAVDRHHMF